VTPAAVELPDGFESWVQRRSYAIDSLSSDDYSDLQFLEVLLEGKHIVALGEDDHWTKEQSQMKVRLIQYLHQELGYEVIAFESTLLDCYFTDQHLEALNPQEAIGSLSKPWRTESVLPLFEYLTSQTESASPLILAGFDIQTGFIENSPEFFHDLLIEYDAEFARKIRLLERTYQTMSLTGTKKAFDIAVSEFSDFHDSIEIYDELAHYLEVNAEDIKKTYSGNPNHVDVARQTAWSKARFLEQIDPETPGGEGFNIRDYGMAQNVIFLAEELYPDKKIILWGHNKHISRGEIDEEWKNMGVYLNEHYGETYFTMGLFGYRSGNQGESINALLHAYGKPRVYLDLSLPETNLISTFQVNLPGYPDPAGKYFDALIYIDKISVPTRLSGEK
jgi:erythromycin esterase